jgi:hypothetical protein
MPTLEDMPFLMKISQQLEGLAQQQSKQFQMLAEHMARSEQSQDRLFKQNERAVDALEEVDDILDAIRSGFDKLVVVVRKAVAAQRSSQEATEERLGRLEGRAMVRRAAGRRADDSEEDDEAEGEPREPRRSRRERPRERY